VPVDALEGGDGPAARPVSDIVPRLVDRGVRTDTLDALKRVNAELWRLEDRARSTRCPASEIVAIKRAIDAANAERHVLIDAVDEQLGYQPGPDAYVDHSQTVGELCDRLTILELKIAKSSRLMDNVGFDPATRSRLSTEEGRLRRWYDHMARCLANLLADMADGYAVPPPRREFKMYNDPLLNPVSRQEGMITG
jgi:hypothetical protein